MEKSKSRSVGGVFSIVLMALSLTLSLPAHSQKMGELGLGNGKDGQVLQNPESNDINRVQSTGTDVVEDKPVEEPVEEPKNSKPVQQTPVQGDRDQRQNPGSNPVRKTKGETQPGKSQPSKSGGKRVRTGSQLPTQGSQTSLIEQGNAEEQTTDDLGLKVNRFGKPCEDEALRKIFETVLRDRGANVLAEMFELTALRLAKRAADGAVTTVEDRLKMDLDLVQSRLNAMKDSKEIQDAVGKIYTAYGLPGDSAAVQKELNALAIRGKDACYFAKNLRMKNSHSSAYVLAVAVGEKDSGLSEVDAATIFVADKLRTAAGSKYAYGTANGNLMNVNVRAARYLGRIHGGVHYSAEEIKKELEDRERKLNAVVEGAAKVVERKLQDCIAKRNGTCPDCNAKDMKTWSESTKVEDLKKGLLEAVSKSDRIKLIDDLKAKMGDVTFDFKNFVQSDTVPRDLRRTKVDACNRPLNGRGSSALPAGSLQTGGVQTSLNQSSVNHLGEEGADQEGQLVYHDGALEPCLGPVWPCTATGKQKQYTSDQFKALKLEWADMVEKWVMKHAPGKGAYFHFNPWNFEAWKKRLPTWQGNHPGDDAPPPNDPLKMLWRGFLKTYRKVDIHCKENGDMVAGKRVLLGTHPVDNYKADKAAFDYRFATKADCELIKSKYVPDHQPHGKYR